MERHEEFRSTSKHNTVVVDGEEQHLRDRSRAFMMKYNSTSRFLELVEKQDCDICTGEYFTIKGRLTHNRSFCLEQQQLTIMDTLVKSGKGHKAALFYHLPQGYHLSLRIKRFRLRCMACDSCSKSGLLVP